MFFLSPKEEHEMKERGVSVVMHCFGRPLNQSVQHKDKPQINYFLKEPPPITLPVQPWAALLHSLNELCSQCIKLFFFFFFACCGARNELQNLLFSAQLWKIDSPETVQMKLSTLKSFLIFICIQQEEIICQSESHLIWSRIIRHADRISSAGPSFSPDIYCSSSPPF